MPTEKRINRRRNRDIFVMRALMVLGGFFLLVATASILEKGVWPNRLGAALTPANFEGVPLTILGIPTAMFVMALFCIRVAALGLSMWFLSQALMTLIRLGGLGRMSGRYFGWAGWAMLAYTLALALEHNQARFVAVSQDLPTAAAGPVHLDMNGIIIYLFIIVLWTVSFSAKQLPKVGPNQLPHRVQ